MTDSPNGDTPPREVLRRPNALRDAREVIAAPVDDEALYRAIVTPERTQALARAIDRGLKDGSVSWGRIYRDIAQKVGVRLELDARVLALIGAAPEVARQALGAWNQVEGMDDEATRELAFTWLAEYHRARGEEVRVVRLVESEET